MKKQKVTVKSVKLEAMNERIVAPYARSCVFKDKKKYSESNRAKWKNDLKKGVYDL